MVQGDIMSAQFDILRHPDIPRKIRVYPAQAVGVLLMVSIPILSLFGFLGEEEKTGIASSNQIEMSVKYYSRGHAGLRAPLHVYVKNRAQEELEKISVQFDSQYIEKFSRVSFVPKEEAAYEVVLSDIQPGETRNIIVEMDAEKSGRHSGKIRVVSSGGEVAEYTVSTYVLP
jgi:hypothetical protein